MSDMLLRAAVFEPSTYDPQKRTVQVVFSTGAEVSRRDWDLGPYVERLRMEASAVNLTELIGGPVLDTHDRFSVRSILGVVTGAAINEGRGLATLQFSERPEVQALARDVEQGILRSVSAGYTVQKWEEEKRADGTLVRTALEWTPKEISFVPIGADANAKVRNVQGAADVEAMIRELAGIVRVAPEFAADLVRRQVPFEDARAAIIREAYKALPGNEKSGDKWDVPALLRFDVARRA